MCLMKVSGDVRPRGRVSGDEFCDKREIQMIFLQFEEISYFLLSGKK